MIIVIILDTRHSHFLAVQIRWNFCELSYLLHNSSFLMIPRYKLSLVVSYKFHLLITSYQLIAFRDRLKKIVTDLQLLFPFAGKLSYAPSYLFMIVF